MDESNPFYVRSSKALSVEDVKLIMLRNVLIDGREWTQTEISGYFYRNVSARLLRQALTDLLDAGKVEWRKQKTAQKGRHALIWKAV